MRIFISNIVSTVFILFSRRCSDAPVMCRRPNRPRSTEHPFVNDDQVQSELVPAEEPFAAHGTWIPRLYATLGQMPAEVGLAVHAPVEPAAQIRTVHRVLVVVVGATAAVHVALTAAEEPGREGICEQKYRYTPRTGVR